VPDEGVWGTGTRSALTQKGGDRHVQTHSGWDSIGSVWQMRLLSYPAMLWLLPSLL